MNALLNFFPAFTFFLFLIFSGCADPTDPFSRRMDFSTVPDLPDTTQAAVFEKENGLVYYVLEDGEGEWSVQGRTGETLAVFFTMRLKSGEILQSTYANGRDIPEEVSVSTLTEPDGLYDGLIGMKVGEHRILVVPPSLGYGNAGRSSQFYPFREDTLIYEIELEGIR
ncbi:MAG: FKBP-type peptidyl-prolyl cis-trans isomerase [Balneolaceae bacterium]